MPVTCLVPSCLINFWEFADGLYRLLMSSSVKSWKVSCDCWRLVACLQCLLLVAREAMTGTGCWAVYGAAADWLTASPLPPRPPPRGESPRDWACYSLCKVEDTAARPPRKPKTSQQPQKALWTGLQPRHWEFTRNYWSFILPVKRIRFFVALVVEYLHRFRMILFLFGEY